MATRRSNVGNIIPNDVLISNDKFPKTITNFSSSNKQDDGPYSNSKQNRHQHRLISHRVMTIVLIIFVIVTAVSTVSFIVKIESNIAATKQDTIISFSRTEQSLLNDTAPEIIVALEVEGGGIGGAGNIKEDNDDNKDNNDKNQSNTNANINLNSAKTKEKPMEIHITFDDPPIYEAPIIDQTILDFDYPTTSINNDAVIVTKIQGPSHLRALRQMLCLLTKAYNNRVQHDIVIFTSELIEQSDIDELQMIVSPAKLTVEIDNPGLQNMVDKLSDSQKKDLLERCGTNITSSSELSWYTECTEVRSYRTLKGERIAYNWQAEFRALWLWIHPLLKPYKYMMWMDSDVFCTRVWKQDPIATMKRHDLVLLFDHFPQGAAQGSEFPAITREAFDRTICGVDMVNGTLVAKDGRCFGKKKSRIRQVHGFFHVSNLDFYRSEAVMKWNRALIGESKFSRLFDDQIGITIPAAVLAGNRSRDMRSLGVYTRVFHNYVIDGHMKDWRGYFVPWWNKNANTTFPEASQQCFVDISG